MALGSSEGTSARMLRIATFTMFSKNLYRNRQDQFTPNTIFECETGAEARTPESHRWNRDLSSNQTSSQTDNTSPGGRVTNSFLENRNVC